MEKYSRKHYRVARKEAEQSPINAALVVPKNKQNQFAAAILIMLFVVGMKWFLLGMLIGKKG
jgi:hypothetical protein